jgi:parvulin-like peptidyl-prolyl isomerase
MPRKRPKPAKRRAQRIIARPLEHPAEEGQPLIFGWGAHLSRREKDSLMRRALIAGASFVAAIIAFILIYAYLNEYVLQARATVARIGSTNIRANAFATELGTELAHRVHFTRQVQLVLPKLIAEGVDDPATLSNAASRLLAQQEQQLQFLPSYTLEQMIEAVIIRQEAENRGYTYTDTEREEATTAYLDALSEDQVRNQILSAKPPPAPEVVEAVTAAEDIRQSDVLLMRAELNAAATATAVATALPPTPTPTVASATPTPVVPTPTPALDARVEAYLTGTGMTQEVFAERVQIAWWRQQLEQEAIDAVPTSSPQVRAQHILVSNEDDAALALERLEAGENFAELAAEMSLDPGSKENGGDLGWFPKGVMTPTFELAAFELEPGQISKPIQSPFGFHIILVLEKADDVPVEANALAQLRLRAFSQLLADIKQELGVERKLTHEHVAWAQRHMPTLPELQ